MEGLDAQLVQYIKTYYPTLEINDDFIYQETLRVLTASDKDATSEDIVTGWCTMKHIQATFKTATISDDLRALINDKLESLPPYPENIRGQIKAIFTYPLQGFLPWVQAVELDESILEVANTIARFVPCKLKVVEGKIYACIEKFNDLLYIMGGLKEKKLLNVDLHPNSETSHITLVNEDVLCKVDIKKVEEMIAKFNAMATKVSFTGCKHTVSLDWPRFSVCCVMTLESKTLETFIQTFNDEFGTKCKPSTHITFLVRNRSRNN